MVPILAASNDPSVLDWITLAIAVIGALTGIASLGWQVWSFARTGPKVKVSTAWGVAPVSSPDQPDTVFIVDAHNVGRSPVGVVGWGLLLPDGRSVVTAGRLPGSSPVPATVDGGHSLKWMMRLADVPEEVLQTNDRAELKLRGFVHLGTGEQVVSRKALPVSKGALRTSA